MDAKLAKEMTNQSRVRMGLLNRKDRILERVFNKIRSRAKDGQFEASVLHTEIGETLSESMIQEIKNLGFGVTLKGSLIRISWV